MDPVSYRTYMHDVVNRVVPPEWRHDEFLHVLIERESQIARFFMEARTQKSDETIAVVSRNPKTAALYFDRINCLPIYDDVDPTQIPQQDILNQLVTSQALKVNFCAELSHFLGNRATCSEEAEEVLAALEVLLSEVQGYDLVGPEPPCPTKMCRIEAFNIAEEFSVDVVPVYHCEASMRQEFRPGKNGIIIQLIDGLHLFDESGLTWDQVREFRSDIQSRENYKNFLHWLQSEMRNQSIEFIRDELEQRQQLYDTALKKHGIRTCLGLLSDLLKGEFVVSTAAVAAASSYLMNPAFAVAAASGLVIGKLTIRLIQNYMDYQEKRTPQSSIAWIHDIENLTGNKQKKANKRMESDEE